MPAEAGCQLREDEAPYEDNSEVEKSRFKPRKYPVFAIIFLS